MRDKTILFKIVTQECKKGCTYHFVLSKITLELLFQNYSFRIILLHSELLYSFKVNLRSFPPCHLFESSFYIKAFIGKEFWNKRLNNSET